MPTSIEIKSSICGPDEPRLDSRLKIEFLEEQDKVFAELSSVLRFGNNEPIVASLFIQSREDAAMLVRSISMYLRGELG